MNQYPCAKGKMIPEFLRNPKKLFQIFIYFLCLGVLYYPVFKALVNDWLHLPDFSHGFFIPFLSLYIVWERSDKLGNLPRSPQNAGIIIILLGIITLSIGNLGSESFTMRFSFLIVLSGTILFLTGWPYLKELLFPILFLIFMIPLPSIILGKITLPMQIFSSKISVLSLQKIGIPVFREGNIIHLASSSLEVAEACSGIRSLISLLALGTLFAYFMQKYFWKRAFLFLVCFPIAIFLNIIRITSTSILASSYGTDVAAGYLHNLSGYLLFLIALIFLFILNFSLNKITS